MFSVSSTRRLTSVFSSRTVSYTHLLTGWQVVVGNDANVAALGEMWKGAGHGEKNMVMVTLGTGVGGGVIMGGRPLIGANGAGGEIGHICVNYFEEKCCGCGKKGCLEQYASCLLYTSRCV